MRRSPLYCFLFCLAGLLSSSFDPAPLPGCQSADSPRSSQGFRSPQDSRSSQNSRSSRNFRSSQDSRSPQVSQFQEVLIAAAADLRFAMDSLVNLFQTRNPGPSIKAVYGSSGNFFEQISNDAPFDLFFSADIDYPRKLQEQKKTLSAVRPYATGEIVLWSRKLDPALAKMNTLTLPSITKIAIANPAHAPYGKRAVESLTYYKLYDKVKDRLVMGENISQAAQFAQSGAADIGIIALSLALSPAMQQDGGKYWLIPAASHQPLQQGYVLLLHASGNARAKKFADFMESPEAAPVLQYFGLGHP